MNKIFVIGILGLLISTGLASSALANTELNVKIEQPEKGLSILEKNTIITHINENEQISKKSGDFDMFLECISWWSPNPYNEEYGVLCWQVLIDSVGDWDESKTYLTTISVYAVFSNDDVLKIFSMEDVWGQISPDYLVHPWLIWMHSGRLLDPIILEKPVSLIVEFETDYPDEPSENNQKTANVEFGITIHGYVTSKNKSGEKTTAYAQIKILADESHFCELYFTTYSDLNENGYYHSFAPYKSRYTYPIRVKNIDADKYMTKYISLVEEFNIYTLDFTFPKTRNNFNQRMKDILVRFFDNHANLFPLFQRLLQRIAAFQ